MQELTNGDNFINWLRSRRSIRRYKDKPVSQETLTHLIEAAIWAPSAHNRQPWRFAILTDAGQKHKLAYGMGRRLRADLAADGLPAAQIEIDVKRSYQRLTGAPAVIVVSLSTADMDSYPDQNRQDNDWLMAVQSTAMAGQNILLSAHALGLGACWMCGPLFCPETVKRVLGLDPGWHPQGLITIGYPAEEKTRSRRRLEQVIHDADPTLDRLINDAA
jgi:coenzyme F420-0:L-glutamate ligase/coenzyme F420-1:gamma-L-glutamate ligase